MIIKKMRAVFGGLDGKELELKPGLNIIEAPNEAGKSTWCAFIRAMLYGINSGDRDKTGYLADKTKFRPWNGNAMEGSMDVSCDGRDITITRTAQGAAPMKKFSAVYTDTAEPVNWLSGETAGEAMLGITEKVFVRSAYIGQRSMKIDQTAELEKRIAAMVSTGDEDISYTEADQRLRAWLRKRKYNKSGLLPKLEEEINGAEDKLRGLEKANRDISDLRLEVERLTKLKSQLTADMAMLERIERRDEQSRILAARDDVERLKSQQAELKEKLSIDGAVPTRDDAAKASDALAAVIGARAELQSRAAAEKSAEKEYNGIVQKRKASPFYGMSPEEAMEKSREVQEAVGAVDNRKSSNIPAVILGAAVLAVLAAGLIIRLPALIIAAACLAAGGAAWLMLSLRRDKKMEAERAELLKEFDAGSAAALREFAEQYSEMCREEERAKSALSEAENGRKDAESAAGSAAADFAAAMGKITTQSPGLDGAGELIRSVGRGLDKYAETEFALKAAENIYGTLSEKFTGSLEAIDTAYLVRPLRNKRETAGLLAKTEQQLAAASSKYDMAQGGVRAMGDPVVLSAEKNSLENEYALLKEEYDAIALAIETLSDANTEIQTRFAPILSSRAGEIMAELTGGRYKKLGFSRALDSEAEPYGSTVSRSSLYLSQGTNDQLYLALRLAICQLVLPDGAQCPIILDDALVNFDDKRMAAALDVLKELSDTRQVLLFTCHSREGRYFADDTNVSKITL